MVVISHFKLYPALFPLKWQICIPNISAVRGNVVFETLHDFYRTAIIKFLSAKYTIQKVGFGLGYMPLTTMGAQCDDCVPIPVFAKSMLTNYLKFSVRGNIPICIFSAFLAEILPF